MVSGVLAMPAERERSVVTKAHPAPTAKAADQVGLPPPLGDVLATDRMLVCRTSTSQNSEPRSRVMISKEYERKIDRIGDRLVNIERLLQRHPVITTPTTPTPPAECQYGSTVFHPRQTTLINDAPSPGTLPQATSLDYLDRDAATSTHSAVASEMVQQAIESRPGLYHSSELAAALKSLKSLVDKIEHNSFSSIEESEWSFEEAQTKAAPTEADLDKLLQSADGSIALCFSPGLTLASLKQKCQSVLQRNRDATAIRCVYVYGVLWHLCTECIGLTSDTVFAERCHVLKRAFAARLGQAVKELKLVMPVDAEAASALTQATGVAIGLGKAYLALALSSTAASMVVSLGYHRLSTMQSDVEHDRQSKILLFWTAYWCNTGFSARLGRAPVIRDYEVTVPCLLHGSILPSSFVDAFNYCITISSLQCQVVEQLYSPLAVRQSVSERSKRATRLVEELQRAWDGYGDASNWVPNEIDNIGMHLLMKESNAVVHYSTVALVQHATLSVAYGKSPALGSARRALELNVNSWKSYRHLPDFIWSGHCHWTLLKAPIVVFTIIFCHIIAHPLTAEPDLALLADFVATLKDMRRFSDGMDKLYKLCDVFCKVATLYHQAKYREAGDSGSVQHSNIAVDASAEWIGQPAVNDIDEYLFTMGLAPPASGTDNHSNVSSSNTDFDASFLLDWYQGNNSLMGFLEQDLAFPGELDNAFTG